MSSIILNILQNKLNKNTIQLLKQKGAKMETNLQFVKRKLIDPKLNINALAKELGVNRYRLDKIASGGHVSSMLIESLYIYFKNSAA